MKVFFSLVALIIAIIVAYLIWEEYILKRDDADEESADGDGDSRHLAADDHMSAGSISSAEASDSSLAATAAHSAEDAVHEVDATLAHVEAELEEAVGVVQESAGEIKEEITEAAAETASAVSDAGSAAVSALTGGVETDKPDNLTKVKGIGKVYQSRLYEAGIYTWDQLAHTEAESLQEVTNAIPAANVESWAGQATELAEKNGRVGARYTGPALS